MLFTAFSRLAETLPPDAGLRLDGALYPYAAVAARAARLATGLSGLGIGVGTPVGLLLPNGPDLFAAAYALFALGAVAVPLSATATPAELVRAARACKLGAIIARDELLPRAAALAEAVDGAIAIIATTEGERSLRHLERAPPLSAPDVPGSAVALYLFSSGSTGRPKVVPHTHAEMLAEGLGVAAAERLTPDDLVLNSLPGHHGFGFMSVHFEAALAGASTLYWSDRRPLLIAREALAEAVAATGATVLPGVSLTFDALSAASAAADLRSLRLAFTGGVGLKRGVYDRFRARYGIALGQAYGCTEAGQVAFHPGGGEEAWASVGVPQANARFAIAPSPDAPDGSGEIVIRGDSLSAGYLDADAASHASFRDGAFHTGDLGHLDADGRLYVTGRSKLVIEVGGHKVDPIEVEDVLGEHPAVAEAVVVGVPDGRTGEQRLKLFAVLRAEARAEELIAFARGRLAAQKVPALVEFLEAIPKSATGKVLRGRLIEGA